MSRCGGRDLWSPKENCKEIRSSPDSELRALSHFVSVLKPEVGARGETWGLWGGRLNMQGNSILVINQSSQVPGPIADFFKRSEKFSEGGQDELGSKFGG